MSPRSLDDIKLILTNFPSVGAPASGLPHHQFDMNSNDLRARTLAGYLMLIEKAPDRITSSGLTTLLESDKIDDRIRQRVRELLVEHDRLQQVDAQATLQDLPQRSENELNANITNSKTAPRPIFASESSFDGESQFCFGWELTGVRATVHTHIPILSEAATLLTTLVQAWHVWQDRLSLGLSCQLNWRYHSDAHRVRLAILASVSAPTSEMAQAAGQGLQSTLSQHLPLPDLYRFEPLETDVAWQQWQIPTVLWSAAEIQRQEHIVNHQGQSFYAVETVQTDTDRLRELLLYLREIGPGQIVDVQIQPTHLTPVEKSALQDMLATTDHSEEESMSIASVLAETLRSQTSEPVRQYYTQLINRLQRQAFVVRVRVGSTQTPDILPLATLTGRALFGLGAFEVQPGTYEPTGAAHLSLDDLPQRSIAPDNLKRLRWVWTLPETAVVARLPQPGTGGLPGFLRLRLKVTRVPAELPADGACLGYALGENNSRVPAFLSDVDRSRHIYIVGRTGTGKTTLLHNMALQDIDAGHGVAVVDPHGDLIESLLARIPPERARDVILFDPGDIERPLGLNLLDVDGIIARNMAVSDFIGLMYSMYDPARQGIVGPRFEQSVRNAMFTAMDLPGATLIDVLRIIADSSYSKAARKYLKDPVIEDYWTSIYEGQSDYHRSEVKDYITSKFSRFTSDRLIRQIIGQPHTTLDFGKIMNTRKILLVNLAKGRIGEFNSHFLGYILVARLMMAALGRVSLPSAERIPFHVFLDEFQNFTTPGMATLLAEGRKYGVCLTLANQFTTQIPEGIRAAVFGNVGTMCAFQLGLHDAEFMAQELYPVFGVDDLVNLPAHHAAIKMLAKGRTLSPFSLETMPELHIPSHEVVEAIRQFSRFTYGRSAALVNDEIRLQFTRPLSQRVADMSQSSHTS